MKRCTNCGVTKDDKEFINERGKVVKSCTKCRRYRRQYYNENKERLREQMKHYCEENVETLREKKKQYREENREEIRKRDRQQYSKNKEKRLDTMKRYYKVNRDKIIERVKYYSEINADKICEQRKHYRIENRDKIRERRVSLAKFSNYANKLTVEEDPICGKSGELLVKCSFCRRYFSPTKQDASHRVQALKGTLSGELRLYCSKECKDACEVYNVKYDPYAHHASVERDPAWAKRIKEEANYVCERCGSKENLEAHHEIPVKVDQSLVNDETNGICLCHECHMKAHSESGCTLADLRKI